MRNLLYRLYHACGPLGAGIVLDLLDLATFGPIGLVAGAVIGGYAGWMLAEFEGLDRRWKTILAVIAAIYMTIPFTEPLPIATAIGVVLRFLTAPPVDEPTHEPVDEPPQK